MGMPAEDFWDGSSGLARDYRKAYKLRIENEKALWAEINDQAAWLNGIYMRYALSSVMLLVNGFIPKGAEAVDYPDKPFQKKAEEQRDEENRKKKEERDMQLAMALMQARFAKCNKRFETNAEHGEQRAAETGG